MQTLVGLVSAAVGAAAGGTFTYLTTRSTMRLQVEYAHDQTLRDKRLEHYQRLFHISRCLPRYWRAAEEPTRQDIARFREEFHDWYFGEQAGGLFLTPQAKDLYLRLQNALLAAAERSEQDKDSSRPETHLSVAESKALRELASELRHQMAQDVGASHPPRLRWTRLGPTLPPAAGSSASQPANDVGRQPSQRRASARFKRQRKRHGDIVARHDPELRQPGIHPIEDAAAAVGNAIPVAIVPLDDHMPD